MKKKYYKLTNQNMQTYKGFQWKLGKWVETKGDINQGLCSNAWLHCYESPLLAVLHNPIHANIINPRLFEVEVSGKSKFDRQLKCGFRKMRLVREIPLPEITLIQQVVYGILCAKQVYKDKNWNKWADKWLSGEDRSKKAAADAYAADAAANADANAAADAYAAAAYAAAYAAANAAADAYAADADAYAAAAYAAADAAANANINLIDIASMAMEYKE